MVLYNCMVDDGSCCVLVYIRHHTHKYCSHTRRESNTQRYQETASNTATTTVQAATKRLMRSSHCQIQSNTATIALTINVTLSHLSPVQSARHTKIERLLHRGIQSVCALMNSYCAAIVISARRQLRMQSCQI